MARFDINQYVDVQERITQFWQDYPDGRIVTYMISDPNIFERVVVRAEVYKHRDHPAPDATDLAAEEQGKGGMANATSWHENASTSAIGRALANMGYATTRENRPSRQEMAKVQRGNDAPVSAQDRSGRDEPHHPAPGPGTASPKQLGMIRGLARQKGIADDRLEARCSQLYNTALANLSRRDASDLIDRLNAVPDPSPTADDTNTHNDSATQEMIADFNAANPEHYRQ